MALDDGELVDCKPIILARVCKVDSICFIGNGPAFGVLVADIDALGEHPVQVTVVFDRIGVGGVREFAAGVIYGIGRQGGTEGFESGSQPIDENDIGKGCALRQELV